MPVDTEDPLRLSRRTQERTNEADRSQLKQGKTDTHVLSKHVLRHVGMVLRDLL